MLILGIHCTGHDTAAALVRDGEVLFAIQEERLSRIKHDGGFPNKAIAAALDFAGATIRDVDAVCVSFDPDELIRKKFLAYNLQEFPASKKLLQQQLESIGKYFRLEENIRENTGFEGKIWYCDHHRAHLASSYYVSGFDHAALYSIDGMGEIACSVTGEAHAGNMEIFDEETLDFPDSIGLLYAGFTHHLGFIHHSDEGKVMGLAPYGSRETFAALENELIQFHDHGKYALNTDYLAFHLDRIQWFSDKMKAIIGPERQKSQPLEKIHMDLSATIQSITEKAMKHTLLHLQKKTGADNLCIAGGVALNCAANGKMLVETPFNQIFVQPAANDSGTAVGAALEYFHLHHPQKPIKPLTTSYLGNGYSDEQAELALKALDVAYDEPGALLDELVEALVAEKIIGWYNHRSEFGPRALGNRSILAIPNPGYMKDILNHKVKHREGFRPFAPVVRLEDVETYFETVKESPYMLLAVKVREGCRDILPAITHIDGTARVQTITRAQNAPLYNLLTKLHEKTGVGILINTSFNVMGEPIVELPQQAISCFLATHMDILVLNNRFVVRK